MLQEISDGKCQRRWEGVKHIGLKNMAFIPVLSYKKTDLVSSTQHKSSGSGHTQARYPQGCRLDCVSRSWCSWADVILSYPAVCTEVLRHICAFFVVLFVVKFASACKSFTERNWDIKRGIHVQKRTAAYPEWKMPQSSALYYNSWTVTYCNLLNHRAGKTVQ